VQNFAKLCIIKIKHTNFTKFIHKIGVAEIKLIQNLKKLGTNTLSAKFTQFNFNRNNPLPTSHFPLPTFHFPLSTFYFLLFSQLYSKMPHYWGFVNNFESVCNRISAVEHVFHGGGNVVHVIICINPAWNSQS